MPIPLSARQCLPLVSVTALCVAGCRGLPNNADESAAPRWQSRELYAPGQVSTAATEVRLAVSPDGRHEVWGVIDERASGWDLLERHLDVKGWSVATPVAFNSNVNDFDPAFSADGKTLFFFSNRAGGLGGDDIWSVPWQGKQWGEPARLSDAINSAGNEWAPTPLASGCLLFASDGHGGAGGMDLFESCQQKGVWQTARALPHINTADHEYDAAVLDDSSTLVFTRSSNPDAGGQLWLAIANPEGYHVELLPELINSPAGWNLGPSTSAAHPGTLFITSYREQQHVGRLDIFAIRYQLSP